MENFETQLESFRKAKNGDGIFQDDGKWRFGYPDGRGMNGSLKGERNCQYEDSKLGFFKSKSSDERLNFVIKSEDSKGEGGEGISIIAFCGDIRPSSMESGEVEVYLNDSKLKPRKITPWLTKQ